MRKSISESGFLTESSGERVHIVTSSSRHRVDGVEILIQPCGEAATFDLCTGQDVGRLCRIMAVRCKPDGLVPDVNRSMLARLILVGSGHPSSQAREGRRRDAAAQEAWEGSPNHVGLPRPDFAGHRCPLGLRGVSGNVRAPAAPVSGASRQIAAAPAWGPLAGAGARIRIEKTSRNRSQYCTRSILRLVSNALSEANAKIKK